jgi:hypothetical protein
MPAMKPTILAVKPWDTMMTSLEDFWGALASHCLFSVGHPCNPCTHADKEREGGGEREGVFQPGGACDSAVGLLSSDIIHVAGPVSDLQCTTHNRIVAGAPLRTVPAIGARCQRIAGKGCPLPVSPPHG